MTQQKKKSDRLISLSGTFEYVDCGIGATTDFSDKNLKGKIALIQRAGEENGEVLTLLKRKATQKMPVRLPQSFMIMLTVRL